MAEAERVLAGLVPTQRDLEFFVKDRWYRIPDDSKITLARRWPPTWVAAFESTRIDGVQQIRYYGRVGSRAKKHRSELFHGERPGPKQGRTYQVFEFDEVIELPRPILVQKNRRNPFIETTLSKLLTATTINDLFDDSPSEDTLWERLRSVGPWTERQWPVTVGERRMVLDFAIFCRERNIDVEVDGRQHHLYEGNSVYDADRDRDLNKTGWSVNRFTAAAVRNDPERCLEDIMETIERCGGLEGSVPTLAPTRQRKRKAKDQMAFPGDAF